MNIRTFEQLTDSLARDFAWRKRELSFIRGMVFKNKNNPQVLDTMIRSGITLLYAHWEGFIYFAGTAYLCFISFQRLRYKELALPFRSLAIRNHLKIGNQPMKVNRFIEVTNFILNNQNERCHIPWKTAIKTRSNVTSKVLRDIIIILGLNYDPFQTKEKLIDKSLVDQRNNIAHGKELIIDLNHFDEIYSEIFSILENFRNQIENAIALNVFKNQALN